MTEHEVAMLLGRLSAAFPHITVDAALAITWAEQNADIPADEATTIARTLIRTSRYFPTIAEFREAWMTARRTHQFHNPYVLEAAYPKLDPAEAIAHWQQVRGVLVQHPTERLPGKPGKPERVPGPPPPPCDETDHAWCAATDTERRELDPKRWADENERRRALKVGGGKVAS